MSSPITASLLAPLSEDQQRVIDLVADAFVRSDYQWPYYSYLEWIHDAEDADAWATLQTFPKIGRFGYSHLSWVRGSPNLKPAPEAEVALTVLGMSHSERLRPHIGTFFKLLEWMAEVRRSLRPEPRSVPDVTVYSTDFTAWCMQERRRPPDALLVHHLLEHEPIGAFGGRSFDQETRKWSREVPREIFEYTGLQTVEDYLDRVINWLEDFEAPAPAFSAPAISIPAAIDHLDDVWRLVFGHWLFELRGAERISSLSDEVRSRDEVEARLSVIGDLFRPVAGRVPKPSKKRANRDHPLASLEATIASKVPQESQARVRDAVNTVEAIIALRDSRQHSRASPQAVAATRTLGLTYPITDWPGAWATISSQVVTALTNIRDELRATLE